MAITVKRLTADDWGEWRSIRLEALADAPDAFCSELDWGAALEARWRARLADVSLNVVASLDGRAVGQVSGEHIPSAQSAELSSLWVAPAARGARVGDALVDAVVSWAAADGATRIELSVKRSNRAAIRLYERHQFSITEDVPEADTVRMTSRALI